MQNLSRHHTLLLYSRPCRQAGEFRLLCWLKPASEHGNSHCLGQVWLRLWRCSLTGTQGSQTYCVGASSEASTPCCPKCYCTNNEHEDKHVKLYRRLHRQGIFDSYPRRQHVGDAVAKWLQRKLEDKAPAPTELLAQRAGVYRPNARTPRAGRNAAGRPGYGSRLRPPPKTRR